MSAGGARWLVTCSCGWGLSASAWAAGSVTKLHPRKAQADIEEVVRVRATADEQNSCSLIV